MRLHSDGVIIRHIDEGISNRSVHACLCVTSSRSRKVNVHHCHEVFFQALVSDSNAIISVGLRLKSSTLGSCLFILNKFTLQYAK